MNLIKTGTLTFVYVFYTVSLDLKPVEKVNPSSLLIIVKSKNLHLIERIRIADEAGGQMPNVMKMSPKTALRRDSIKIL